MVSFLRRLEKAKAEALAQRVDPWRTRLEHVRGQIGDDGMERLTTQLLLDILEIPQRSRRAGTYRRLAKLMSELGWAAVRVRGITRGGYLEQVRGDCRLPDRDRAHVAPVTLNSDQAKQERDKSRANKPAWAVRGG